MLGQKSEMYKRIKPVKYISTLCVGNSNPKKVNRIIKVRNRDFIHR